MDNNLLCEILLFYNLIDKKIITLEDLFHKLQRLNNNEKCKPLYRPFERKDLMDIGMIYSNRISIEYNEAGWVFCKLDNDINKDFFTEINIDKIYGEPFIGDKELLSVFKKVIM